MNDATIGPSGAATIATSFTPVSRPREVAVESKPVVPPDSVAGKRDPTAPAAIATPIAMPDEVSSGGTRRPLTAEEQKLVQQQRVLEAQYKASVAAMSAPENQIPALSIGQAAVGESGAPNGGSVAWTVASVEGDNVTIQLAHPGPGQDAKQVLTRAQVADQLLSKALRLEMHATAMAGAPRVPSVAEQELTRAASTTQQLSLIRTRLALGAKPFRIFTELATRRGELVADRNTEQQALDGWLKENGGLTSMKRIVVASVAAMTDGHTTEEYSTNLRNAELLDRAPQRDRLETINASIAEIDRALASVSANGRINFQPVRDGVTFALHRFSQSTATQPRLTDRLIGNDSLLRGAVAGGDIENAWAGYQSVVQPYLFQKGRGGDSFHRLADGRASLTLAVNQLISEGTIGNRALITSPEDYTRLRSDIQSNWPAVQSALQRLGGRVPSAYDAKTVTNEQARVGALRSQPALAELTPWVDQANKLVPQIVGMEPGWIANAGHGVAKVLDSPETWAMIAATTLTAGTGAALLGSEAIASADLLNLARGTSLSVRSVAALARGGAAFGGATAVDGALVHTATQVFNGLVGNATNYTPEAYLQSIAMMGASEITGAMHAARAAAMSPGIIRAAGENARHFAEEALALTVTAQATGGGTLGENLSSTAQMMAAMRLMHATRAPQRVETNPGRAPTGSALARGIRGTVESARSTRVEQPVTAEAVPEEIVVTGRRNPTLDVRNEPLSHPIRLDAARAFSSTLDRAMRGARDNGPTKTEPQRRELRDRLASYLQHYSAARALPHRGGVDGIDPQRKSVLDELPGDVRTQFLADAETYFQERQPQVQRLIRLRESQDASFTTVRTAVTAEARRATPQASQAEVNAMVDAMTYGAWARDPTPPRTDGTPFSKADVTRWTQQMHQANWGAYSDYLGRWDGKDFSTHDPSVTQQITRLAETFSANDAENAYKNADRPGAKDPSLASRVRDRDQWYESSWLGTDDAASVGYKAYRERAPEPPQSYADWRESNAGQRDAGLNTLLTTFSDVEFFRVRGPRTFEFTRLYGSEARVGDTQQVRSMFLGHQQPAALSRTSENLGPDGLHAKAAILEAYGTYKTFVRYRVDVPEGTEFVVARGRAAPGGARRSIEADGRDVALVGGAEQSVLLDARTGKPVRLTPDLGLNATVVEAVPLT